MQSEEKISSVEKFKLFNTLACLLKALENRHTIIDLRNESSVSGLIKHADGNMNVEMADVVFYNPRDEEHVFETFHINARNIRYVHILKGLSPSELMQQQIDELKRVRKRPKKKPTFKTNYTCSKIPGRNQESELYHGSRPLQLDKLKLQPPSFLNNVD